MLSLQDFRFSVSGTSLINSLSVSLLPGSITYLLGKNGAGKTTILHILAGLKTNYQGSIKLYDLNLTDYLKPFCLYVGHKLGLEKEMKVIDQLEFWANCYNSPQMIPAAIEIWDLHKIIEQPIKFLSEGNLKKVALSKLTCCHAELWLLDEIEANLDENNLKILNYSIQSKASSGGIILLTTHMQNRIKGSQVIDLGDFSG